MTPSLETRVKVLTAERDALAAARYAYASEFALDEGGEPDVGSIHQNIRALKAAAKLALEAMEDALSWVEVAHRPPVCDKLEIGRMVMIRLHALASLKDTAEQLRKGSAQ